MQLPNSQHAVVDPKKVRDYLLSPEHPVGRAKARFFAALGFQLAEWPVLQAALLAHGQAGQAIAVASLHGQKYEVRGILQGPGHRNAAIITVWIILRNERVPRLITAYPEDAR